MQPVLSPSEMREVDARAESFGVAVERLVERAGTAVARQAAALLGGTYGRHIAVVAGRGNNGADGRVAARLLERRGARVDLYDAKETPAHLGGYDLVVDAAYGTGFHGEYKAPDPGGALVLAVDVPSGLDSATGEAADGAVKADLTVTFGAYKTGLLLGEGRRLSGRVVLASIGLPVPPASECAVCLTEDADIALLPRRDTEAHKWQSALAVVAGSPGMYGAPTFVSRAAARAGAGMVRLGIPGATPSDMPVSETVSRVLPATSFHEAALAGLERCKALVVGPGLGTERQTRASVRRLVAAAPIPVVVDADGLTALGEADSAAEVISARSKETVLTPHAGEYARLAGEPPDGDRIASVRRLAASTGAVILLKGSTTVVAEPAGRVILSTAGSSRLATAGTGDVLSGVIGAFLARGMRAAEGAALAAHIHGRAAELGYREGLLAGDLPELVAEALSLAEEERAHAS